MMGQSRGDGAVRPGMEWLGAAAGAPLNRSCPQASAR